MMADVIALWYLEKKPPIPMVSPTGSLILLFWLERRAYLHGSTPDEALTPLWMPQRIAKIIVSPGEES